MGYVEHFLSQSNGRKDEIGLREGRMLMEGRMIFVKFFKTFLVLATAPCTENWSNGLIRAPDQQAFGVNGGERQLYPFIGRI